ncbi:MAG TPA: lipopolysaccharide kinase InaA family protein [Planctomycetota bacterium]|nr:lipopolysaccharide kinase InaA family protein [Planctomycetota bacterium]
MATFPVLERLPGGYFLEESPRGVMAVHGSVATALHGVGFGPESDGHLRLSQLSGRRPLFELDTPGETFLLRRFSHGGLLRWATGSRFLDAQRPFRELILSDELQRIGVATPTIVAARARRRAGAGWTLDLLVRRVDDALDLRQVLDLVRSGALPRRTLAGLARAAGDVLRRLHGAGFLHRDLQPANLLVQREGLGSEQPTLWVLDLDRSDFRRGLNDSERRRNLRRLLRRILRDDQERGTSLSRTDYVRFMSFYDPEGQRWKGDWRAIVADQQRGSRVHGTGWALERTFARRDGETPGPSDSGRA